MLFPISPNEDSVGGGEGLEEEEEEVGEEVEQAVTVRPARDPKAPTKAEREAHEPTHLPFRSWSTECVAGRRDNPPHTRRKDEERQVPEVSMDYAFVRREEETETVAVLVVQDRVQGN